MMRPKFKDIKIWSEEKMLSHKVVYDNSDPHLNFSMEVHQELHDVDIHLEVRIANKQDSLYTTTLNTTLNVCRILGFANQSPVGRFVHGFIREYGNIIDNCPIAKVSKASGEHARLTVSLYNPPFWSVLGPVPLAPYSLTS